jgi:hypothetical protein
MKSVKKTSVKKPVATKRTVKKYQSGGVTVKPIPRMEKSQAKAEEFYDNNPSVRKSSSTGPVTEAEYQAAAERAASAYNRDYVKKPSPTWGMKKGGAIKKTSVKKYEAGGTPKSKMSKQETKSKKPVKPEAAYGMAVKPSMMKKGGATKKSK